MQITSIVLHYNRPENMKRVIDGIRNQTVPSEIWVWDNSGNCPADGIDVLIRSSRNFYCQPRFTIGHLVRTLYTYNQDDDLQIKDNRLFEKLIDTANEYPEDMIGWNGRIFSREINWDKAYQSPGKGFCDNINMNGLDMMNVGVSFFRTEIINKLLVNPFQNDIDEVTEDEYKWGDDMFISNLLPKEHKRITEYLKNSYEWLPEGQGLSKQTPHMDIRNRMCQRYWGKQYGIKETC